MTPVYWNTQNRLTCFVIIRIKALRRYSVNTQDKIAPPEPMAPQAPVARNILNTRANNLSRRTVKMCQAGMEEEKGRMMQEQAQVCSAVQTLLSQIIRTSKKP
jgi:hypothetical protein